MNSGRLRAATATATLAVALAACGGGGGRAPSRSRSGVHTGAATSTPSSAPAALRVPPAFAGRLLRSNELSGFRVSDVSVYTSAGGLVSSEQLGSAQSTAELRMLERAGFAAAVREDLYQGGNAALSQTERFTSPAGARYALRSSVGEFQRLGQGTHYLPFPVSGVPGAVGFVLGNPGGTGINIAFSSGDFYYLVGRIGSGPGPEQQLTAAARLLYGRVRG
jgi:hypothetical protein